MNGKWKTSEKMEIIVDPMNGEKFLNVPQTTQESELNEFAQSLNRCPKSGLHNPIKNVERSHLYLIYSVFQNA